MDVSLRKRHFYLWIVLSVVLVALMSLVLSVDLPETPTLEELPPEKTLYSLEVASKETELVDVRLLENPKTQVQQLSISLKQALVSPAPAVYVIPERPVENIIGPFLLGNVYSKGTYTFELPEALMKIPSFEIELRDDIKQNVIQKISF
jgi:hypothetical protein